MIEPVQYIRKLEGKSNAHLITFNDGNDYVVKFLQRGFEKSLANEWVAYCLGRYLGVPIPYSKLVEIPQDFRMDFIDYENIIPTQFQFASLYIPGCKNGHEVQSIKNLVNKESLASIIVFDYWLQNRDRTKKNILLKEDGDSSFQIWAIDHAEVFNSYNWRTTEIPYWPRRVIKSATHQMMASFIVDEMDFTKQIEIMQGMPNLLIEDAVEMIPGDWLMTDEEKKAMIGTLVNRRKKIVPKLIQSFLRKVYYPLHISKKHKTN